MSEYINNALLPVLDAPRTQPIQESPKEWGEWLTAAQAVEYTGMSHSAIRWHASTGRIPVRKIRYNRALYSRDGLRAIFGEARQAVFKRLTNG